MNAQERVKLNVFFRKRTNTVEVDFFKRIDATNAGLFSWIE